MRNPLAIRVPLVVVLNVPFTLILLVSAALIGFLGIQNGTAVASDLTRQLVNNSASRVQQDLDAFLDTARLLNNQNIEAIRLKQLDLSDFAAMQRRFLAQLRAYPTIQDIAFGSEQREFAGAWRNVWGVEYAVGEATTQSDLTVHTYEADPSGGHGNLLLTLSGYDFRLKPWYQLGAQAGHLTVTPIYTWVNQLGIAIDVSAPVYNERGELLGVLAVSLNPASISAFLKKLSSEQNVNIFIVDESGLLVASSTIPQPYERVKGVFQRFDSLTSSDPFVQSATKRIVEQFGGWSNTGSSRQFDFEQTGEKSLAQVISYQGTGSQWRIVVAVPESTYLGPINNHIAQTLLLIFISLLVSVGLLTLVSQRITHPILQLNRATKAIAAGDWSQKLAISHQNELGELAASFNRMADQLEASTLALQFSEARLRAIFENSADAIALTDQTGFVTGNPAFAAMFGFRALDPWVGKAAVDVIAPSERLRIAEYIRQRADGDSAPPTYETRGLRQDGTEFDMEVRVSTFVQNGANYSIALLRDISDRKRAEEHIRQSEERFRKVFAASPDVISITSLEDGRYLDINERGILESGYSREEYIGHTTNELNIWADPEQRSKFVAALKEQGFARDMEQRVRYKSGELRDRLLSAEIIDLNSQPCVLTVSKDITERKRAEEQLRQSEEKFAKLFATSPDIISLASLEDGRYVDVNEGATVQLGYTREEFIGHTSLELNIWQVPEQRAEMVALLKEKGSAHNFEALFRHKDGHTVVVLVSAEIIVLGGESYILAANKDITDRKQAEDEIRALNSHLEQRVAERTAELEKTKNRLEAIFNHSGDAIVLVDVGHGLQQANAAFEVLFEVSASDGVGRRLWSFFVPRDQDRFGVVLDQVLSTRRIGQVDVQAQRLNGSILDLEISLAPVDPLNQTVTGLVCIIRDVTERKLAERALRDSENMLQNVIENIPVQIFWKDRLSVFRGCNSLFLRGTGRFSMADVIGKTDYDLEPERAAAWEADDRAVMESGQSKLNVEECVLDAAGGARWLSSNKVVLRDSEGSAIGVLVTIEDVTPRKQAEFAVAEERKLLRTVIDAVPDQIYVKDTQHRFLLSNIAHARMAGVKDTSEVIGKTDADLFPTEVVAKYVKDEQAVLSSGKPILNAEERALGADDHEFWMLTSLVPFQNLDGSLIGLVGVTHDITTRKQAEVALQQALEHEKELSELRSRFLSMASHEFRTPLASVLSAAELLLRYRSRMDEAKVNQRLSGIAEQVKYLTEIINDVLDLSRMQSGRVEMNLVEMDLDELCRDILEEFRNRTDIVHKLDYSCELFPLPVRADKRLMREIVNNLVSNAVKYSPPDRPVLMSLELIGEQIIIRVRDRGIGIPPADQKRLFEAFHRAGNVGEISGTGLGLTITKQAVELHGGTIICESEVGHGTTFVVTLPRFSTVNHPVTESVDDR